jgi:hypothetical protein
MCIDTVLGDDGKIAHHIPFPGWWGKPKSNWLRPILFQPDGVVRFTADPEDEYEEVHSKMNIFNVAFEVGARITMIDLEDNEETTFVVKQITDLFHLSIL